MTPFTREKMAWCWRDPRFKLAHIVSKCVGTTVVERMWYVTWCGDVITVDDVTRLTKVEGAPTCLGCVVATPFLDGGFNPGG